MFQKYKTCLWSGIFSKIYEMLYWEWCGLVCGIFFQFLHEQCWKIIIILLIHIFKNNIYFHVIFLPVSSLPVPAAWAAPIQGPECVETPIDVPLNFNKFCDLFTKIHFCARQLIFVQKKKKIWKKKWNISWNHILLLIYFLLTNIFFNWYNHNVILCQKTTENWVLASKLK